MTIDENHTGASTKPSNIQAGVSTRQPNACRLHECAIAIVDVVAVVVLFVVLFVVSVVVVVVDSILVTRSGD